MKVYVNCVACEQRQLDSQKIINYLKVNKIDLADSPKSCDYAILVTCAVDLSSEDASLSMIERVSSQIPPSAKLIVGGCLPSISLSRLLQYDVDQTFSPRDLEALDSIFGNLINIPMDEIEYPNKSVFDSCKPSAVSKDDLSPREEYKLAKKGFKIRINQGCLGACSYCMIRKATRKLHSEPLEDVVKQLEREVSQREKTVMLMGGDTGAYGIDTGIGFFNLLTDLLSVPGDYELFIHDFNVNWLIRDVDKYMQIFRLNERQRKIRSINFPVQSGSDRILKLMRRPYKAADVVEVLTSVKKNSPSIRMGTHVMVGFPSETEDDLELTLRMLEDIGFDFVTCFAYSEHKLADSARVPEKVDQAMIKTRMEKMSEHLQDKVKFIW